MGGTCNCLDDWYESICALGSEAYQAVDGGTFVVGTDRGAAPRGSVNRGECERKGCVDYEAGMGNVQNAGVVCRDGPLRGSDR